MRKEIGDWIVEITEENKLGEGGMGKVYLARHKQLGTPAAIKFLPDTLSNDAKYKERFFKEVELQKRLKHSNVAEVLDWKEETGRLFLIMEYLSGGSLANITDNQEAVEVLKALKWIKQILEALNYAHQKGVIHRDIKPSNIILDQYGNAKVVDFGIALEMSTSRLTTTGVSVGTPHYMSPEQIRNSKEIDHRTDVYSAATVLYEMLTGKVPFDGDSDFDVKEAQVRNNPAPLRQINPKISSELENIVLRGLAKDRDQRYSGCGEFALVIKEYEQKEIEKCAPPIQAQAKKESRKTEIKQNDDQSQKIPVQIELKLNQLEQTTKPQAVVIKPKPNEKQDNQFVLQDNQVVLLIAIFIVVLFVIAGILYFPNTQPATEFPKKMPDSIATPSNTPEPQNTTTLDKPTTVMLGEGTTKAEIYDTVISPNGYFVASVGAEKQVYLWRVANGSLISKLDGQTDGARTVAFSPDSQLIASGCDDKSVRIWKTNDGSLYKELKGHTDYVFRVGFSQDGEKLISAGGDKKVKTWQVNDGALLKDTSFYETLVTIASDIDTVALYNDNNEITFWSFSDGKQLSSLVTKTVKIRSVTYGVFSPNQKIFALGNKYGEVNLWNAKKGNLLVNFSPSKGQVVSITFSQDSQNVSVGYSSGIIKIYSSTDGSLLYQQMMENSQQTTALSADGKVIVSANNKTKLQIWQINY